MRKSLAAAAAIAAGVMSGFTGGAQSPEVDGSAYASAQRAKAGQQNPMPGPTTPAQRAIQALMRFGSSGNAAGGYRSREGWTHRRYQRAALKRRNKARHRAACKRAKGH